MKSEELKRLYRHENGVLMEFMVIESDDKSYYIIPSFTNIRKVSKNTVEYSHDKDDAMYKNFLARNKPISNYKSSPYYRYYYERAKKENPEMLI